MIEGERKKRLNKTVVRRRDTTFLVVFRIRENKRKMKHMGLLLKAEETMEAVTATCVLLILIVTSPFAALWPTTYLPPCLFTEN